MRNEVLARIFSLLFTQRLLSLSRSGPRPELKSPPTVYTWKGFKSKLFLIKSEVYIFFSDGGHNRKSRAVRYRDINDDLSIPCGYTVKYHSYTKGDAIIGKTGVLVGGRRKGPHSRLLSSGSEQNCFLIRLVSAADREEEVWRGRRPRRRRNAL